MDGTYRKDPRVHPRLPAERPTEKKGRLADARFGFSTGDCLEATV
jgi:hypothetical protein